MKKKINIILILAVGGLWSTVGYRFVKNYLTNETLVSNSGTKSSYNTKLVTQRDTFLLENITRDPFLNRIAIDKIESIGKRRTNYSVVKKSRAVKPVAMPKYWPDIQYLGYIKSGKNSEVVLLKINGQLMRLRKGESRNELTVQNVYKDSIAILFNKEKKIFKHS